MRGLRLLASALPITLIGMEVLDRLIHCSKCAWANMPIEHKEVVRMLGEDVIAQMEGIELEMNWDRGDEEVSREKEKTRNEKSRSKPETREKRIQYNRRYRQEKRYGLR